MSTVPSRPFPPMLLGPRVLPLAALAAALYAAAPAAADDAPDPSVSTPAASQAEPPAAPQFAPPAAPQPELPPARPAAPPAPPPAPPPASAEVRAVAPARPRSAERVSIGAGIGFVGAGALGGLAGLGALASQPVTPVGTALIELLVSRHFRIVFSASGGYRSGKSLVFTEVQPTFEGDEADVQRTPSSSSNWSYGARTGLRWVINPGGVVEVSPLLTLGYSRYGSKGQRSDSDTRGDGHQKTSVFDAQLGLVLERRLMEQLYLRFASSVVQFSSTDTSTYSDTDAGVFTVRDDESTSVGLAFSPSIELRLTF